MIEEEGWEPMPGLLVMATEAEERREPDGGDACRDGLLFLFPGDG